MLPSLIEKRSIILCFISLLIVVSHQVMQLNENFMRKA